jgi:hypothetical protein
MKIALSHQQSHQQKSPVGFFPQQKISIEIPIRAAWWLLQWVSLRPSSSLPKGRHMPTGEVAAILAMEKFNYVQPKLAMWI